MPNLPLDIALIAIFAFVQWRIVRLLLAAMPRPWMRYPVYAFTVFVSLSYVFTFSAVSAAIGAPAALSSILGAGSLTYFMTVTGVLVIHQVLGMVGKAFGAGTNPGRRRVLNVVGGAIKAAPFAAVGYGSFIQRTDFRVREVEIPFAGLPPDLDGLRILHLSDIHLSAFLGEDEFARAIDASNSLHPNVAIVTGDLISGPGDPLDACIRQVARLRSDAGTFACMGNHERYARA